MNRKLTIIGICLSLSLFSIWFLTGCYSESTATARDTQKAEYDFWSNIGKAATDEAGDILGKSVARADGDSAFIVLTNAGYALVEGHTTEACLDGLADSTGASVGTKTLLSIHSSRNTDLWFFLCEKDTGEGIYLEVDNMSLDLNGFTTTGEIFSKKVSKNIKSEILFADPEKTYEEIFQAKPFGGIEFALISISNMLMGNAPYDLVKCAQFHDHYCPGVTSGYMIADYLEDNYPLDSSHDKYFVLSVPPWCKDDALMQLLNTTPGKRGYAVFYMNSELTESLVQSAKKISGIYFRHSSDTDLWEGVALGFDFSAAMDASGINWNDPNNVSIVEKLKMDMWLMDNLDYPLVSEIKRVSLEPGEAPSSWALPGSNPLEKMGLLNNEPISQ